MLFYRAALPLSRQALTFTAGVIRRHRKQIGSAWRKLSPGQQASRDAMLRVNGVREDYGRNMVPGPGAW